MRGYQFLVLPGGFCYGDDVAAGKILANQMIHRLAEALNEFVAALAKSPPRPGHV